MNVDLLIMLIILYIIKDNNSQCLYHNRNQNQNLSIPFIPINERKPYLNNKYNHTNLINNKNIDYMYYPNLPLRNSNSFKNSPINTITDKDITINRDSSIINNTFKDNHKVNSMNTNENTITSDKRDDVISKKNTSSIDTDKDSTMKKDNTTNTITDKDITINKDNPLINNNTIKDNLNYIKNIDKVNSINSNENNNINDDKSGAVSKNNSSPINTDKNSTIKGDNTPNTIDNKDNIINDDKNDSISNNKNSNQTILKNKSIKSSTNTNNRSVTYNNLHKKDYKININNTFNQLQLSKGEINKDDFIKNLNPRIQKPTTDFKTKVPVLIGSTSITEVFHGDIKFSTPIISIQKVTSELFITNKSLLPNLHCNNNNAILYYEGFLKTQLEYLKDVSIEEYEITGESKYYIMCVPFSGSKSLTIYDETINSSNTVFQDFTLDINKSTFSIDNHLEEPIKKNKYINLYKLCNLTIKVDCNISLYRKQLVQL